MAALIIGLVVVAGLWLLSAPLRKQYVLGQHLSGITTWIERIEHTRLIMPVGAGGGADSLPMDQQILFAAEMDRALEVFRTYPRHVITRELIKNYVLASNMGRPTRAAAIDKVLEILIDQGVALGMDEFSLSYST